MEMRLKAKPPAKFGFSRSQAHFAARASFRVLRVPEMGFAGLLMMLNNLRCWMRWGVFLLLIDVFVMIG